MALILETFTKMVNKKGFFVVLCQVTFHFINLILLCFFRSVCMGVAVYPKRCFWMIHDSLDDGSVCRVFSLMPIVCFDGFDDSWVDSTCHAACLCPGPLISLSDTVVSGHDKRKWQVDKYQITWARTSEPLEAFHRQLSFTERFLKM